MTLCVAKLSTYVERFNCFQLIVKNEDGFELVPEMYAVSAHNVNERVRVGKCPFFWAQSLYILGKLLQGVSLNYVAIHHQVERQYLDQVSQSKFETMYTL